METTPGAPAMIHELVERFERNREAYRSGHYNETQLRREFLDPFFKALGWDVDNQQGYAEAYKDVVHEDAIQVEGASRAPDYAFRVGGTRKFFVEAKKPSVNIREDISPAYQVRRYAWSAKLPLSILTDFEEFAVYDCRVKPDKTDKPGVGRVMMLSYRDYLTQWQKIAGVFSREAVLKGSFDQFAEAKTAKKGTAEVDDAFLMAIEAWRELLARNFSLRNPEFFQPRPGRTHKTCQAALNYAVQRTIDRIIFLRIAEDRGIEEYGRLRAAAQGKEIYQALGQLFVQADARFNSGLFHFDPDEKDRSGSADTFTLHLKLDDKPLKEIINGLYYPDSPFEFSVIPADILGQVYERFLGKVIQLSAGGRATIEEKPEVRKAGGVFYTPTYIVEYIVRETVGRLLDGKTPDTLKRLRVVDMSCGSGSFLIGAYQFLLDWYLAQYTSEPEKWAKKRRPPIAARANGQWWLTIEERKRILLDHVYGVDIDPQAVEVTKLSLLLKVLEGENANTLGQLTLFHDRALPDLDCNIQCGNSLIGPDFYDQPALLDDDTHTRINVFDWKAAFPQVFKDGGFDAVIGNPPYIRIQTMKEWAPLEVEFYKKKYLSASKGNYDIYVVFVEKGLGLLNENGKLGYILPHKFFNAQYGEALRGLIAKGKHLSGVVHFGDQQVFEGATTYTCLFFINKKSNDDFSFEKAGNIEAWRNGDKGSLGKISNSGITENEWNFTVGEGAGLFERLSGYKAKLGDVASIFVGLQTSADKAYILEHVGIEDDKIKVKSKDGQEWTLEKGILKPILNDVTVSTYTEPKANHWLIFPYRVQQGKVLLLSEKEIALSFPNAWKYLKSQSRILRSRENGKADNEQWYGYIYRKNLTLFEDPKLIVQVISLYGRYSFDNSGLYFTGGGNGPYYGIRWFDNSQSIHYLQGLLSSKLLDFFLKKISSPFRGNYWSYGKRFIEQLPIRTINFSDPVDTALHTRMVELVQHMLDLHRRLPQALTPDEKTRCQRQIEAADRQIDRLVYQLYGLSEAEIQVVEGPGA